jgi:hypothetical protein
MSRNYCGPSLLMQRNTVNQSINKLISRNLNHHNHIPQHQPEKRAWWRSKWAIAAHIATVYFGVSYYVNSIVQKEIEKQRLEYENNTFAQENNGPDVEDSLVLTVTEAQDGVLVDDCDGIKYKGFDYKNLVRNTSELFSEVAPIWDTKVWIDEVILGIWFMRRSLMKHAHVCSIYFLWN